MAEPRPTASGAGRILVTLYGVFALAAGSRAAVQLGTRFQEAPVAYLLSAFSALVYVIATVALAGRWRWGDLRAGRPAHGDQLTVRSQPV